VVVIDETARQPRLQIPKMLLPGGAGSAPPARPLQQRSEAAPGPLGLPTIVAVLDHTGALVSGGFWLVRRGLGRTIASAILVMALGSLGATALWADLRPPLRPQPKAEGTPLKLPAGILLPEKIMLEYVDAGDSLKLIIPPAMAIKVPEAERTRTPRKSE
jgi:hypothetical protein